MIILNIKNLLIITAAFSCNYITGNIRTEEIGTLLFFKLSDKKAKESVDYVVARVRRSTNCALHSCSWNEAKSNKTFPIYNSVQLNVSFH